MHAAKIIMWAVIGGVIGCVVLALIGVAIVALLDLSAIIATHFGYPKWYGMVIFYFIVVFLTFGAAAGLAAWGRAKDRRS